MGKPKKPHLRLHVKLEYMNNESTELLPWYWVTRVERDGQEAGGLRIYLSSAEAIRRAPR